VQANVISQHPGSGMGLVFRDVGPGHLSTLEYWLCESLVPSEPASMALLQVQKTAQIDPRDDSQTSRLIQTLVRKGILTQSEAVELLRDSRS
jgi:hypothetical protein